MTTVRFFTSAALRAHEEVDGEIVQWLPRWITVELAGDQPLTGVWQSATGARRVCWYRGAATADIHALHAERYGDEPYWVVTRHDGSGRCVEVDECDASGALTARHRWDFDKAFMPAREELVGADGTVRVQRRYHCFASGLVDEHTEAGPPTFTPIKLPRPEAFPIPELAGEPFPCGGLIGGARILSVIARNQCQARCYAAYRTGSTWARGIVSMVTMKEPVTAEQRRIMDFEDPLVAVEVDRGILDDPRHSGFRFRGWVEAIPAGSTLEELVAAGPIAAPAAVDLVRQVGEVAERAHRRGHALAGIRPELIYARPHADRLELSGILHRAAVLREATYSGEAILWPPMFHAGFHSRDDVAGLAQLLWHLTTGGHPFLAPDDVRWQASWNEFRHNRVRPQPWTGPAALGPVLARALDLRVRPALVDFLRDLAATC